MSKEAIRALKHLFDFAEIEARIATQQASEATDVRDFRASDRHQSYSLAMRKVREKAMAYAREHFLSDISGRASAATSERKDGSK